MDSSNSQQVTRYEIRYQPLSKDGRALSFPCDEKGHVHLDALSEHARNSYLYARAVVGREYAHPAVLPCDQGHDAHHPALANCGGPTSRSIVLNSTFRVAIPAYLRAVQQ